jgi:hypothetical protein
MPRSSYCFHLVILITGSYSSWQFGSHHSPAITRSLSAQSNSLSLTEVDSARALWSDCPMLFNVHGIVHFKKVFLFCENKFSCFFTLLGLFLVFINCIPYQSVQPDRRSTLEIDSNVHDCFTSPHESRTSRQYRYTKCDFTLSFAKITSRPKLCEL